MWLDKVINDPIMDDIQALQKAKCQTDDCELIRKYNRKIDLLVDKLYNKYMGDIINEGSYKEYYYQIDYIDKDGLATYIDTEHNRAKAIRKVNYLNYVNSFINRDTMFVLDKYSFYFTDEGEPVGDTIEEHNITGEKK